MLKVLYKSGALAVIAFALAFSSVRLLAASEIEDPPIISPDGTLELYESPGGTVLDADGKPFLYGTKLYLRQRASHARGILIRENDRWMHVQWIPHSDHLIAVEDHWDPDASGVIIFKAKEAKGYLHCFQIFKTPDYELGVYWTIRWFDMAKG